MKKLLKKDFLLILTVLVGCSSQNFNKKIETSENDGLKEESFMRYNSDRFIKFEKSNQDNIQLANSSCHQEKFIKGKDLLEEKMQSEKNNPYYWNALGTCYMLDESYTKALFFYDLGIESLETYKSADKNLAEATITNNLGLIHLKFKRYNEAFDSFSKANQLAPNIITPKVNMAQIYLEFNQNDRAIDLLKSIENNSSDTDLLYNLSLAYFRKGESDKAFSTLLKVHKDSLNRADIVGLYASCLLKKNRIQEAKNIIEKRVVASEFENRNKIILEEINEKIKSNENLKK